MGERESRSRLTAFSGCVCATAIGCVLGGCFGGLFIDTRETHLEAFTLGGRADVSRTTLMPSLTAEDVRAQWGEPDAIHAGEEGETIWRYKNGWSWAGFIPILLLPVPLMAPTGSYHVEIQLRDDLVVGAVRSFAVANGVYMGVGGINTWVDEEVHGDTFTFYRRD